MTLDPIIRYLRPAVPVVLALLVLSGSVLAPSGAGSASASQDPAARNVVFDRGPGGERYVALGDSGAAGPVLLPQRARTPRVCTRSAVNYPSLLATALSARAFSDATCSGARIEHLYRPQGDNPAQLRSLRPDTTLVTLNIGPNDTGLSELVAQCSILGSVGCDDAHVERFRAATRAIQPRLERAVDEIRARSPRATIVMAVGARFFPPRGCFPVQPYRPEKADTVQDAVDFIVRTSARAAAAAGVQFTDLRRTPGFIRHTSCNPVDPWVMGAVPPVGPDGAILFHPTAAGMRVFAREVERGVVAARR